MTRPRRTLVVFALAVTAAVLAGCQTAGDRPQRIEVPSPRNETLARDATERAGALIDKGELDVARTLLEQAVEADIGFGPARNNLGVVYLRQQNLYDAAWQFQYAAKLMPHNPEPRNNLGLVFERVGRLDEAVDWYAQAVDLSKDNPQLLGNLIRARLRRGDRDRQTLELLDRLVLAETRPDWRAWAQEQRALLSHVEDRQPDPSAPVDSKLR